MRENVLRTSILFALNKTTSLYDAFFTPNFITDKVPTNPFYTSLLSFTDENSNAIITNEMRGSNRTQILAFRLDDRLLYPVQYTQIKGSRLVDSFSVLSPVQYMIYMFATSIIFRFLEIVSTSMLNTLDKKNWNVFKKSAATVLIIGLTYGLTWYISGYHVQRLFLIDQLINFISHALNNANAFGWSNRLRELKVLSTTKYFNFTNTFSRELLSSLFNAIIIDLWRKTPTIYDTLNFPKDDLSALRLCHNFRLIHITQSSASRNAQFISNEVAWLGGRMLTNLVFAMIQKFGGINDLRTPFDGLKRNKVRSTPAEIRALVKSDCKTPTGSTTTRPKRSTTVSTDPTKRATQQAFTPPVAPARAAGKAIDRQYVGVEEVNQQLVPAEQTTVPHEAFTIPGHPYSATPLSGSVPNLTWGVVGRSSNRNWDQFANTLASSGNVAPGAGIKSIGDGTLEIRPRNTGNRLLGRIANFFQGARELLPLGLAIEADQRYNPTGKAHLVVFKKEVKHDDISKGKAALLKEDSFVAREEERRLARGTGVARG